MGKLERRLDLISVTMEAGRPLTRHEIRDTLPAGAYAADDVAFRRTFERDKDELRALGIELTVAPAPDSDPPIDGYRIDREAFGVDLPTLDPDESTSLALATAVVRIDPDRPGTPIWLLGDSDGGPADGTTLTGADVPGGPDVRALMRAVTERRVVSFSYRGEERVVEPHRLVFTKGRWQLTGHDRLRDDVRQFRSDRIQGAVSLSDEPFDPPVVTREVEVDHPWRFAAPMVGPDGRPAGDPILVRVRVDARHAAWLVAFLGGSSEVEPSEDGSVVITEQVRDVAAFRSFVLTFLDGAEILEPPEVRDDMVAWLEGLAGTADRGQL